ncbi:MAG TPA: phosphotransferase, partial [Acidimicrobiales bacterium]
RFAFLAPADGTSPLRRHVDGQRSYYRWTIAQDGRAIPLIERAFDWLEAHWPAAEPPPALSWGDARIGNVLYDGFRPVAVLDWEMTALAPREVDLAWMIYLHRFFQDLATSYGLAGLPDFMRREDVVHSYRTAAGYEPRDLDFFLVYAILRHAIVMTQTKRRAIHFGEDVAPPDPDEMILHRATLEQVLDGSYRWT